MSYHALRLALAAVLVSFHWGAAAAQEWTRFRGPNGAGQSEAPGIPTEFTDADFNWRSELPGIGHASPVIWENKVFLLSADPVNATRFVVCLNTSDGSREWVREFPSQTHPLHTRSSYASSTPTVDAEHVYAAWSSPEKTTLICLDHDGKTVWELDLGRWVSQHGFGTSPILYRDLVILFNSQDNADKLPPGEMGGESHIMAFDRKTGQERWRTPMTSNIVSYSVPCIYEPEGGKPEVVCCSTAEGVFGLDPENGKMKWSFSPFTMRTVSSPVIAAGLIFGSNGSGAGGNYVAAVRPGQQGAPAELAYKFERQANYVPTTLAHGEFAYLWSDKGIVSCIDAADGKVNWQERVGGNYSGSPIRVRDRLYCMSDEGDCVVLAAGKEFKLLARNPLGEESRSTPAVSSNRMYLRTFSHLISIGGMSK